MPPEVAAAIKKEHGGVMPVNRQAPTYDSRTG